MFKCCWICLWKDFNGMYRCRVSKYKSCWSRRKEE